MISAPRHFLQNLGFALLTITVVWVFYGGSLLLWTHQTPGAGEDGSKNYFTVEYHIRHDPQWHWFTGMNYPEGEHVVYTDNQPLIANLLRLFGGSADRLPFLVFLSLAVGAFAFRWLLAEMGVARWLAALLALGTMLLSPQLIRLGGHYSLAYVGLIPVFIFLLHKNTEARKAWSLVALVTTAFLSAFLHPYFVMMLCLFWLCFALVNAAENRDWKNWKTLLIPVLPLVLFQAVMWLTDPVGDRPSSPYGLLFYRATWASIFMPLDYDYFAPFALHFQQSEEGGFYVGILALVGLLVAMIFAVKSRKIMPRSFHQKLLLAALPMLLIAVAFPFYIWKFDRLVEYLGPLRQFRGVGRFSFVFFYAVNLFAAVEIGRRITQMKAAKKYALGALAVLVLFVEAWGLRNYVVWKTSTGTTAFHNHGWGEKLSALSSETHQCIVPLPYFHVGSENFRTPEVEDIKEQAFAVALETGIPLQSVQMSRTSLKQTLEHIQLHTFLADVPQTILDGKYNALPLLWLIKQGETLNPEQQKLVAHSSFVAKNGTFELRQFEMKAFVDIPRQNVTSIEADSATTQSITSVENMLYYGFDNMASSTAFIPPGALEVERQAWTEIIHEGFPLNDTANYELSFWFYAGRQHAVNTQLWLWERENGQEVRFEVSEVGDHIAQVMGDWILVSVPLVLQKPGNTIQLVAHRDGDNMKIVIDELMVRPLNRHFFKPGPLNFDNRYMTQPPHLN